MQKPLLGQKAAILVANGFEEVEMATFQRGLLEAGATPKIISTEKSLAHGWQNNSWGHYFAVEGQLADALAADYDILIIPGGSRSHEKLLTTGHTKRFIGGFVAAAKPIVALGDAVQLIAGTGHLSGYTVTGNDAVKAVVVDAGATWLDEAMVLNDNLISAKSGGKAEDLAEVFSTLVNFVIDRNSVMALDEAA